MVHPPRSSTPYRYMYVGELWRQSQTLSVIYYNLVHDETHEHSHERFSGIYESRQKQCLSIRHTININDLCMYILSVQIVKTVCISIQP